MWCVTKDMDIVRIDEYNGVPLFIGSYDSCVDYINKQYDKELNKEEDNILKSYLKLDDLN